MCVGGGGVSYRVQTVGVCFTQAVPWRSGQDPSLHAPYVRWVKAMVCVCVGGGVSYRVQTVGVCSTPAVPWRSGLDPSLHVPYVR